jgi:hypothetical protein
MKGIEKTDACFRNERLLRGSAVLTEPLLDVPRPALIHHAQAVAWPFEAAVH